MVNTYATKLAGQVEGTDPDGVRRHPSNPTPTVSRKASLSGDLLARDSGLNKRAIASRGGREPARNSPARKPSNLSKNSRRNLPWLDGKSPSIRPAGRPGVRHVPGSFVSESDVTPPSELNDNNSSPVVARADTTLQADSGPKAAGSVATLCGTSSRSPIKRTDSLSSMRSPSRLRPAPSTGSLTPTPKLVKAASSTGRYTPSDYSLAPPSDYSLVVSGQREDPSVYQQLMEKPEHLEISRQLLPSTQALVDELQRVHGGRTSEAAMSEDDHQDATTLSKGSSDPPLGCTYSPVPYPINEPVTVFAMSQVPTKPMQSNHDSGNLPLGRKATLKIKTMQAEDMSPTEPSPKSGLGIPRNTRNKSLRKAVSGLEDLMQEALHVARDAAQQDRVEEATMILDEAALVLRKATTVRGLMLDPLPISDSEMYSSESSFSDSDGSSVFQRRERSSPSMETVLTRDTHPSHPVIVEAFKRDGQVPESEHAELIGEVSHLPDGHETEESRAQTPPRFYSKKSADSIVIDWAYAKQTPQALPGRPSFPSSDSSLSNGRRPSVVRIIPPQEPPSTQKPNQDAVNHVERSALPSREAVHEHIGRYNRPPDVPRNSSLRHMEIVQQDAPIDSMRTRDTRSHDDPRRERVRKRRGYNHPGGFIESPYYRIPEKERHSKSRKHDVEELDPETPGLSLKHPRKNHFSLRERQGFSLRRHHPRPPVARNWNTLRKRITASIACINTALVGLIIGVYAGEVPAIQYRLADQSHEVILGNVFLYIGLAISTLIFWPLPLLHGRKPYTLIALAIVLPLQFPQALCVDSYRSPSNATYRVGLLLSRAISGLALGFANINFITTLFDLFGVSLQSSNPHQEIVVVDDVRRHGGGMGLWLGIWTWCFIGSLAVGFLIGAGIIADLDPSWGFYVVVILIAFFLLLNVIAPEPRRAPYRRSVAEVVDEDEKIKRRVARGEVKLHISQDGPRWWFEEVWAGVVLLFRMLIQPGFLILAVYLAWIYAQVVLIIVLLGALLSRNYHWRPQYVGLGVFAIAIGALLAVPLSKASLFSRARTEGPRTDSMTLQPRVTWSSHLVRRVIFVTTLPFAGLAYTLASPGASVNYMVPIIFAGLVGFLSALAIAECNGLIMETFDTSDLQPGANTKHRLQSMASNIRRRHTNYSSFPRVCAGIFASQGIAFLFAAAATSVGSSMTRSLGAQAATGVVAGILLALTVLLILALWRFKSVQVIPNHTFGTRRGSKQWREGSVATDDAYWKPVIIGNPSGKMRRMSLLELGAQSRWTEIRKLNKLIKE